MSRPASTSTPQTPVPQLRGTLPLCTPPVTEAEWLWTREQVEEQYSSHTPRRQLVETRDKAIGFLYSICVRLAFLPTTYAVGATVFHRFYMRQSLHDKSRHPYEIAATCVLIASKIDETVIKLANLVVAVTDVAQKGQVSANYEAELQKWRSAILKHEQWVLAYTGFTLHIHDPFRPLFNYLHTTSHPVSLGYIAQSLLIDSYRTILCLQYQPTVIAAAALFIAGRIHGVELIPHDWWSHMQVDRLSMLEAATQMLEGHNMRDSEMAKNHMNRLDRQDRDLPRHRTLTSASSSSVSSSVGSSRPISPHSLLLDDNQRETTMSSPISPNQSQNSTSDHSGVIITGETRALTRTRISLESVQRLREYPQPVSGTTTTTATITTTTATSAAPIVNVSNGSEMTVVGTVDLEEGEMLD